MSGEAKSRSAIRLPGVQEELLKALVATGKPVVVLIHAGRPLVFNWIRENVPTIVYAWWLGTRAGSAIADVLFGDYNPSGKLPMTFPRSEGQIPVYYNHYNTGRPAKNDSDLSYVSAYTDLLNSPAYPFGHGLSYTQFGYSPLALSERTLRAGGKLQVSVTVTNTGGYAGEETVQLYIRDRVGSVVRPVKELKQFQKCYLQPGESRKVTFILTPDDLRFYDAQLRYRFEAGAFDVFVGGSSATENRAEFTLLQ
jgi:beta-glucosidase